MKKHILIALALLFTIGTVDVFAQNFLDKMKKTVKKEVENRVNKGVKKALNKGFDSVIDDKKQTPKKTQQSSSKSSQTQKGTKNTVKEVPNGTLIAKMDTWKLDIKDGMPCYGFLDDPTASKENYFLHTIKYEHPNGVKPFMFTTAVATFKAKDGYYFNKSLKLNEYKNEAETTTGFKVIDNQTVKVYLTAFTGAMGHNVKITKAMKEYKKKVSEMNIAPIATAKINAPLFDHWDLKLKRRSFEFNDKFVRNFIQKNMRAYYAYPTTEEFKDSDGNRVRDGGKESYPSEYKILSIDVLDDDLSDDIPGLVGEWCLISKNQFIPKACLKNIQYGGKFAGAPSKQVDSPFKFAGGSGTIADPYLIKTPEQLNAVRKGPKNHYKLIADIDLSNWGNWIPIGATAAYGFSSNWNKADKGAHAFMGSFDGNGHVIKGMKIIINEETPYLTEGENWRAYGLFATLATNPDNYKIKNLGVVNFDIDVNYTNVKKNLDLYASAICGGMNNGTDIVNCYSKGGRININVTGNEKFKEIDQFGRIPDGAPVVNIIVGGISATIAGTFVGQDNPRKTRTHIERCFNDSHIIVNAQNCEFNIRASGIVANMETSHIHECYNSGNITLPLRLENLVGSQLESIAAGICSYAFIPEIPGIYHTKPEGSSYILNCYNTGQIVGRSAAGIFDFSASDIHLENCYNTGVIIGNEFDDTNGQYTISTIFSQTCAITKYGTEFVRKCFGNGNSVTGSAWKSSSTLKRMILAAIPEDSHPSKVYKVEPKNIGSFTDVKVDAWYAKAVQWALNNDILSGTSATTFSGGKACTKADFYSFLWRAVGSPKPSDANPFSDVKATDPYYEAALWASEKGLVSGKTFTPNTACTRGEIAISLWKSIECPDALQANMYLDIANHQSEIGKAISWGFINSVMAGTERYKFSPNTTCTKAQVISYIYRTFK